MPNTVKASKSSSPESHSSWYLEAMEQLVGVVQELSQARDVNAVTAIVREAARNLTGADGASFILRDGDQCYYAEENAIAPLWKGKRFPMSACLSGWVMLNAQSTVIEDIYVDPRIPVEAYRPTFVKSMAMVPIRRNAPIGAIGNYWATHRLATEEEMAILQALADTTSVALENAELYGKLQQQVHTLQEQQVRIQGQHEALEVFTRALAHDLKEPVRTLMSFSRMLKDGQGAPEKKPAYFQYIQDAADRMGMLIDTVFQYTQLDDPSRVTKELCKMENVLVAVKENLAQLIQERGAVIDGDMLAEVEANPAQMAQVMQNLIANAMRHNEGKVTIQARAQEMTDHWLFSVRDNGAGMAQEHTQKIFQPFKRLTHKEECAGLGLAICKKIITSYGGKIWCESTPGQGATFYFTLPKPATAADAAALKKTTPANILLVDDREADLELTRLVLVDRAELECNVLIAHDGTEAHGVLKESDRKGDKIDLVVLDINMPGMDGFELLENMRKDAALKNTAVVMCTGSSYEKDKHRAESLGAIGYLVKPTSFEKLKPMLAQVPALRRMSA